MARQSKLLNTISHFAIHGLDLPWK